MTKTLFKFSALVLCFILKSCSGQEKPKNMEKPSTNPLLCNPEPGICELPTDTSSQTNISTKATIKPLKITYFTDPICSSCWGIEPQLRKLKLEYGHIFEIEYHMGGLLPDWSYNSGGISKPSDVATHWDEVSQYYEMPIDGDVWLEDPLDSSYPPSIAFKAAQLQDTDKAILFLRRIREMVFLEKKNICKWENLQIAANQVGLDAPKMKTDMQTTAKSKFIEDLDLGKKLGVRGFPTLFVTNQDGQRITLYGYKTYQGFEDAILQLAPSATKKPIENSWQSIFEKYKTLTLTEYATLSNTPKIDAELLLKNLANEHQLETYNTKNGKLWIKK